MTGSVSPAAAAMSVKCGLNGRPEGADLGCALAVCVETPCGNKRAAGVMAERPRDPMERFTNDRRLILISSYVTTRARNSGRRHEQWPIAREKRLQARLLDSG